MASRYLTPVAHGELGSTYTRALRMSLCALKLARSGARRIPFQSVAPPAHAQQATSGSEGEDPVVMA